MPPPYPIQPPTVLPVLLLLLFYVLMPWHLDGRWRFLAWVAGAAFLLFLAAKFQPGLRLEQDFFSRVSPDVEKLQRMRASYVFVGMWFGSTFIASSVVAIQSYCLQH